VRALKAAIQSSDADLVLSVNIADVYPAVARIREHSPGKPKVVMALHGLHAPFFDDIARVGPILDGVIAANRLAAAAAIEFGNMPETRVHYASCGVVVGSVPPASTDSDELTLLYAGRFDDNEKRIGDLPPILKALDSSNIKYSLRLAGSGPDEAKLRSALAKFGGKVEFLDVLGDAAMRSSFYRPGAILLIMSPSETGPLVAWEAMASGVALVTSRFVGMGLEGSLGDGENCLTFPVGDTDLAAAAIIRLQDLNFRRDVIQAGFELVRQRYSREASVHAWDHALRQVQAQPALTGKLVAGESMETGRLDRQLGVATAETVRRLLGVRFRHSEPGGEWPHSYGRNDNEPFRQQLAAMDRV
jgi:glycosyltransferase involved in cell wall biosynthesis